MAARVDYVVARVGYFGNRRDSRGGFETAGDAIAMAARGATLEVPPGPQRLARRTRALLAAALLSVALAATAYAALSATGTAGGTAASRGFSQAGLLSLPLAARGPASAAIGSYQPGYGVRPHGSGLTAWSAAQRLSSGFSSAGVSVRSGRASLNMRLAGVGYGTALRPVPAAVPRASDNRVTYSRPGLQEWYANGPLGLEQGFTLARAPAGATGGPLTLALSLAGSAHATLSSDRQSVKFGSSPKMLRYGGLSAEDASGRRLQSWLSLSAGRLLLHVSTAGARYPLRIDPFVQTGEAFSGTGATKEDEFGHSVALSGDGKTAIVGAYVDGEHNPIKGWPGAAFVFIRNGSKWEQQGAKLTASGGEEPTYFGNSVALSKNGNTAIVGSYGTNGGNGAAYVFTRTGSTWKQLGEPLLDSEKDASAYFGWSVALNAEGNTALIGGPDANGFHGGAWVFARSGETYAQQGAPLTGNEVQSEFGYSVALSGDGLTALIGAHEEEVVKSVHSGSAYAYRFVASKWTQQARLVAPGGNIQKEDAFFGTSVALSENGNTALVGAECYECGSEKGGAFVSTRSGEEWKEKQHIESPGTTAFGGAVALSANGTTALVARGLGASGVWAYTLSGGEYKLIEKLEGKGGKGPFGVAVAVSENGETALVGGKEAAWAFGFEGPGPPPAVVTQAASEVTSSKAHLNGTVNPHGKEVTECKFEYGTTASYGSSTACSLLPGKGEAPVAVAAAIGSLSANTIYHFRVVATNSGGTSQGEDDTFTTLMTSATGESTKEGEPAKAKDEGLSVQGSEGTGKVTIGPYGSNIGGPPLADGKGTYVQVYHSEGASFKKMEYEDCELGGAKAIWWENPATGWEAIQEPVAVYDEETKCIKVTATESTTPSIAELSDPRHVGGPSAKEQFGKCEAVKHGHFADELCQHEDYKEKGQVKSYKGKYEWLPAPVGCFAMKHGRYSEGNCQTEDLKKGQPKGKYEKGVNSFKVAGGSVVIAVPSQSSVQCLGSSSTSGLLRGVNQGSVTLTLTGCERAGVKCASAGEIPGTIVSQPLESYSYEEGDEYFTTLAGKKGMMTFSCATTEFRLSGAAAGLWKVNLNAPTTSTEATFSEEVGAQELELEETRTQSRYPVTLTTKTTTTTEQPVELKVNT